VWTAPSYLSKSIKAVGNEEFGPDPLRLTSVASQVVLVVLVVLVVEDPGVCEAAAAVRSARRLCPWAGAVLIDRWVESAPAPSPTHTHTA